MEPFTKIPSWLAPPIPAKKLRGMLTTRAQGQLMTRNVRALYTQVPQVKPVLRMSPEISGGSTASARALRQTMGV